MHYLSNGEIIDYIKTLRDIGLVYWWKNIFKINSAKLNVYKKSFKKFVKSLMELKSLLKIKSKRFVVLKKSWWMSNLFYYERLQQLSKLN